jgi:hypothetical protein
MKEWLIRVRIGSGTAEHENATGTRHHRRMGGGHEVSARLVGPFLLLLGASPHWVPVQ